MGFRVTFKACGDGALDLLGGKQRMLPQGYRVVLAHQQGKDVDVILLGFRPINQESRPCPLAQGVIDIFGIVREHAKGAIAPHNSIRPGKAFHQDGGDLQLPGAGLPVAALASQLIDIVDRAEPDDLRIDDGIDECLGVLTRLALITVNVVRAQVLIAKRITRDLAIVIDQPGHHLDQGRLARSRHPIAHKGKDEPAQFRERVQSTIKVIGHKHLGQFHRLIFGDVVAHDFVRFLERHGQRGALGRPRRFKATDGKIVGLNPP